MSNVLNPHNNSWENRKVDANEILIVSQVNERDEKAGLYKVLVRGKPPVQRNSHIVTPTEAKEEKADANVPINQILEQMQIMQKTIMSLQETVISLQSNNQPKAEEVQAQPRPEPETKEETAQPPVQEVTEEIIEAPQHHVFDHADLTNAVNDYNRVLQNTLGFFHASDINVERKIAKAEIHKTMPTVAEINRSREDIESIPIILDKNGEAANHEMPNDLPPEPIQPVYNTSGKIDVIKTLGIRLANSGGNSLL